MIDSLTISHFKCFEHQLIELKPLTVLTGLNGGGKSSVLQAILLARQAAVVAPKRFVELNGPYRLALGEAREVLNPAASDPTIRVDFRGTSGGAKRQWNFVFAVPDVEQALYLDVVRMPRRAVPGITNNPAGFTYLSAERLGPRDMLSVSAESPEAIGVGVQGEYTAQVLALRETRQVTDRLTVRPELRHARGVGVLPRLQAEAWMSEIVRPIEVNAQWAAGVLASTIRFREKGRYGAEIRPANNGFGVSYTLPIIVASIISQPGDMLLVENPEAHLHPGGQSALGRFLARVAGSGVQVILETHSDHVLNGARLAIAEDRSLAADEIIIHYLAGHESAAITVSDSGEVSYWPNGFFDQIESDLGKLSRARRA